MRRPRSSASTLVRRRARGGALALLGVVVIAACGPQRRSDPLRGRLIVLDSTVALGEQLFSRECQSCHPRGERGLGPALNDKPLPEWAIALQVRQGYGAMPAFSPDDLSDAELNAVISYLKAVRNAVPVVPVVRR